MTSAHLAEGRLSALRAGASPDDDEAEHLLDCRACTRALEGRGDNDAFDGRNDNALGSRDDGAREGCDDALDRALAASRRVEPPVWNEARVAAGQARLAGAQRRRRAVRYAAPAFAGALAAAALWALWQRPPTPSAPPWAGAAPVLAEVEQQPGAALSLAQSGPDEIVEVARGQASFKVRHLQRAERFRVRCGRDEVEVRGTRFVVRGGGEGLASVAVSEGAVEVRTECCGTRLLRAGETWARPAGGAGVDPTRVAPTASASAFSPLPSSGLPGLDPSAPADPSAPGASSTSGAPSASSAPPIEPADGAAPEPGVGRPAPPEPSADVLRQRALEAYDGGRYALAARAFERAAQRSPDAPWAADARTLAGAARVLQTAPGAIAALSVSVASLDAAAQRAQRAGDSARASAARVAAARRSSGEGARKRWCALRHDALASADVRREAQKACPSP